MNARIHLSSPDVTSAEEAALVDAVRSGWIAPLGPDVDAFEHEVAEATDRSHAVALSSGTAALHLGLLGLGVAPGTVVITSTMTFAATANAIVYTGAEPVFVDSDATGNIAPDLLERAIRSELARGAEIAAILPVDLLGKPADYAAVEPIADRYGIPVLADAAESLGAVRDGRRAGSSGAAAALSFNGNKIITTSGGGMLLTDDGDVAARARYLATQARQPVVHYEHVDIGYNYRLSNLLAGLGRAQLRRLPEMLARRRAHRVRYRALFDGVPGTRLLGAPDGSETDDGNHDNFWLTTVLVDHAVAGWRPEELGQHLAKLDIEARPLWKPMHLQPVFADRRSHLDGTSEQLFATGLSLPSGSALTDAQVRRIDDAVTDFLVQQGDR